MSIHFIFPHSNFITFLSSLFLSHASIFNTPSSYFAEDPLFTPIISTLLLQSSLSPHLLFSPSNQNIFASRILSPPLYNLFLHPYQICEIFYKHLHYSHTPLFTKIHQFIVFAGYKRNNVINMFASRIFVFTVCM